MRPRPVTIQLNMAGEKVHVHVLWSPNTPDEFATYSTQLKIYAIEKHTNAENTSNNEIELVLSNKHSGRLLASVADTNCAAHHKTVAWQTDNANAHCFAIGQSNGRISLISLHPRNSSVNSQNLQLSTKTLGRTCYTVSWSPKNNKLLAQGLEKTRTDSSLIVWDVTRATPSINDRSRTSSGSVFSKGDNHVPSDESGKIFETGNGESTTSVSWLPGQPNCLVAGMGSTYLKIFDIRDGHGTKEPKAYAQNKAIYGLAVDPQNEYQIASFAKSNTVYLWDIRNFKGPVYSFQRQGNIGQLEWMPTRPGCLSVILSEAPYLRLINIPQLSQAPEAPEEYLCHHMSDRFPLASKTLKKPVVCVEWHSEWMNTGLYVNSDGIVKELNVCDKIPVTWSSHDPLTFAVNGDMFTLGAGDSPLEEDGDISHKMLDRVKHGYGFDISHNISLLNERSPLHQMWSWIKEQTSTAMFEQTKKVAGVNVVLESLTKDMPSSSSHDKTFIYPTYSSRERTSALRLCGWSFIADNSLEEYIKREEMNDRFERAAAISVFCGNIKLAISTLRNGAATAVRKEDTSRSDLNLIALSLAGFSAEPSLWQETCSNIKKQIFHPYLGAIFNFLCAGRISDEFRLILNDTKVMLRDRVALGCVYLNDRSLHSYLVNETCNVISDGKIEGLFLTGLGESGRQLLENYVNKTGDVQSACLIAGQNLSDTTKGNPLVSIWVNGYRDLLDQWQLWKERSLFDHERNRHDQSNKTPRLAAAILCTFCSKSISSDLLRQDITNKSKKATSCPSCRKPLPRCSICLLHMVAGVSKGKDHSFPNQTDQFGQWFTWCQTCRHGGHSSHMTDWFKYHEVCPVTNCTCHCMSLDCLI